MKYLAAVAVLGSALAAQAQFTYPGCDPLQSSDFGRTELFSRSGSTGAVTVSDLSEPVAMAFNAVKSGDSVVGADIYLVQRKGVVRKYDFTAKTVKQIGFVNNAEFNESGNGDNGLMGIALDPNFATNRWVYLWYIPQRVGSNYYRGRLSRFTLGAQDTLQLSTEKILIDIQLSKTRTWHSGGPMRFDAHGDLWVTIGNNGNDLSGSGSQYSASDSNANQEWGSSSTASMRGGVIRIHPDNSAKGYSIPANNFGAYWANHFQNNGNATLAAQYRDTLKVLPEIYVKGTRSNYSIWVHPTKRWLAWGEVNYQTTNDEYNLVTTPAFTGFPYFHRNNVATPGTITPAKDTLAPTNTSPMNSGVQQLPPAKSAAIWYNSAVTPTTIPTNVAIGGDVYLYDRNLKSAVKFPPHLHHQWLMMQSVNNSVSVYGVFVDSAAVTTTGTPVRLDNGVLAVTTAPANVRRPVQASYGPDGALYFLNYGGGDYAATGNSGVLRVTYNGTCKLAPSSVSDVRPLSDLRMTFNAGRLQILEAGRHEVTLLTAGGREVFRAAGDAGAAYDLGELRAARGGVYLLRVKTAKGVYARNLPLF
ncbi:MAG: carbohydrate-binding protein [Fibrobacteria bacterium]|jgi:cytochrome c|nr:carbohydrate-binding protein [Fibrobacteria bacterium]